MTFLKKIIARKLREPAVERVSQLKPWPTVQESIYPICGSYASPFMAISLVFTCMCWSQIEHKMYSYLKSMKLQLSKFINNLAAIDVEVKICNFQNTIINTHLWGKLLTSCYPWSTMIIIYCFYLRSSTPVAQLHCFPPQCATTIKVFNKMIGIKLLRAKVPLFFIYTLSFTCCNCGESVILFEMTAMDA